MILTNKDQTLIILDQGAIPARWQKGAGDVFYPFGVKTVTITVPKEGGGGEEEEVDKLRGGSPSPAPNFGPPVKTELYQLQ
ncbi:MAG: hypothetical protein GTN80_03015, partial [Nitrososphaeria archaeon]|nr:hypothetical protein [Nitrososphaeria archaeon]